MADCKYERIIEPESNRDIAVWKVNGKRNFVKALFTICLAGVIGVFGILFALGWLECSDMVCSKCI